MPFGDGQPPKNVIVWDEEQQKLVAKEFLGFGTTEAAEKYGLQYGLPRVPPNGVSPARDLTGAQSAMVYPPADQSRTGNLFQARLFHRSRQSQRGITRVLIAVVLGGLAIQFFRGK